VIGLASGLFIGGDGTALRQSQQQPKKAKGADDRHNNFYNTCGTIFFWGLLA